MVDSRWHYCVAVGHQQQAEQLAAVQKRRGRGGESQGYRRQLNPSLESCHLHTRFEGISAEENTRREVGAVVVCLFKFVVVVVVYRNIWDEDIARWQVIPLDHQTEVFRYATHSMYGPHPPREYCVIRSEYRSPVIILSTVDS